MPSGFQNKQEPSVRSKRLRRSLEMHLQKRKRQLLPGLVAGDVSFHPCIPEVNVLQDAS